MDETRKNVFKVIQAQKDNAWSLLCADSSRNSLFYVFNFEYLWNPGSPRVDSGLCCLKGVGTAAYRQNQSGGGYWEENCSNRDF